VTVTPAGAASISPALVASFGMYDFPWTASAHDALWAAMAGRLRAAGIDAPTSLSRGVDPARTWRDPRLIFGQTCGYPYVTQLRGETRLVATPIYTFSGCEGPAHGSAIVVNRHARRSALADYAGACAAVNARDSNTGMNLFRATIAPLARARPFFGRVIVTGSHEASLEAVASGEADIAAIDEVSLALLQRGRPELGLQTATIARTPRAPSLPYIISAALAETHLDAVRTALFATLEDLDLADSRRALGLAGAAILEDSDYDSIAAIEEQAIAADYPVLE
jgi:ABC-type phosphate/phosphonate transport system substrate-binding protein